MIQDKEYWCFQRGKGGRRGVLSFQNGFSYNEKCGTVTEPDSEFHRRGGTSLLDTFNA